MTNSGALAGGELVSGKRFRVVIVGDDESTFYAFDRAFHQRPEAVNWDLYLAKDCNSALRHLHDLSHSNSMNRLRPNMVLIDWDIPEKTLNVMLKKLQTETGLKEIPVMLFSGDEARRKTPQNLCSSKLDHIDNVVELVVRFWLAKARQTVC